MGVIVLINNWHVPRNKRKLYPVVGILSAFSLQNLGDIWSRDLNRQLDFETMLEDMGLKRPGARRDRRAGGARTYESWLYALGLTFIETQSSRTRLTLVGEELINGAPPVPLMTNQLMKLQYPSAYSMRSRVQIHERFRIRPFRYLIRLLLDDRLAQGSANGRPFLSKSEIGVIVSVEAENESDELFEHIIQRILEFRRYGYDALHEGFEEAFPSSTTGERTREDTIKALNDNANVIINFLEYSQLVVRDASSQPIYIPVDMMANAEEIINDGSSIRNFNTNHEFWAENFQRSFGLPPGTNRDNRQFQDDTVNENVIVERMVRNEFLQIARIRPITEITSELIERVSNSTGIPETQVSTILNRFDVDSFGIFETEYIDMAFSGREFALAFEHSTVDVFNLLGYSSTHVGNQPRNPDVLVESPNDYTGIIDNKAYHVFSITHDYENRMKNTYIPAYRGSHPNLSYFLYIAGGFGSNINSQIQSIHLQTGISGSCITAADMMRLLRKHEDSPISQQQLKGLFECNRLITTQDVLAL
jgi:hypothetical protein